MSTPPEPEHAREIADLRHRLDRAGARVAALETYVQERHAAEHERALTALYTAFAGAVLSLFLPAVPESGAHHLLFLLSGEAQKPFVALTALAVIAVPLSGVAALRLEARSAWNALNVFALLAAFCQFVAALSAFGADGTIGPGLLLGLVATAAVPVLAPRARAVEEPVPGARPAFAPRHR